MSKLIAKVVVGSQLHQTATPESDWDYRRRRYFVFVDSEDRENVEVIGNIHENPELLGGKE